MLLWQPIAGVVWSVELAARGATALSGVALLGWSYLFAATFAIDHFELFGLQQSWRGFHEQPPARVPFCERWMYRFDRHPIMTGVLVGLWATPEMTAGRLLFAAGLSAYVLSACTSRSGRSGASWAPCMRATAGESAALVPTIAGPPPPVTAGTVIDAPPERAWDCWPMSRLGRSGCRR